MLVSLKIIKPTVKNFKINFICSKKVYKFPESQTSKTNVQTKC